MTRRTGYREAMEGIASEGLPERKRSNKSAERRGRSSAGETAVGRLQLDESLNGPQWLILLQAATAFGGSKIFSSSHERITNRTTDIEEWDEARQESRTEWKRHTAIGRLSADSVLPTAHSCVLVSS